MKISCHPKRRRAGLLEDFGMPAETNAERYDITMQEASNKFLGYIARKNSSEFTVKHNREVLQALNKILSTQNLPTDLASITDKHLAENFVGFMVKRKLKPSTINGRITVVKHFFRWLHQEQLIHVNPANNLHKVEGPEPVIYSLTNKQMQDLLDQPNTKTFCGLRDKAMLTLSLDTGIRLVEIAGLTLSNLNLEERTIRVFGKGKWREIGIKKDTHKIIKAYLKFRGNLPYEEIFVTRDFTPMKRRTIQDMISKYGKTANITNVAVSQHNLRRSYAKFYLLNGGDWRSLQDDLGQTTPYMVQKYTRLWLPERRQQHEKFSPINNFRINY